MKTLLGTAAVLAALSLAACGDDDSGTAAAEGDDSAAATLSLEDVDGRTFASARVEGHRLVGTTQVMLGFRGEQLSANAGCNHLSGQVRIDDGELIVRNLAGTEMGCPDDRAQQDAWLTAFLTSGPQVSLAGDTLTVRKDDVVIEMVKVERATQRVDPDDSTADPDSGVVSN